MVTLLCEWDEVCRRVLSRMQLGNITVWKAYEGSIAIVKPRGDNGMDYSFGSRGCQKFSNATNPMDPKKG